MRKTKNIKAKNIKAKNINVKNIKDKNIKKLATKKRKNLMVYGAGQFVNNKLINHNLINKILTNVNATPGLIHKINNALQTPNKPTVKDLQSTYSKINTRLFDLIYADQTLNIYDPLKLPSLIWDHGSGSPETITAGKPGTHIYVYEDSNTGLFSLLGVIENIS